MREVIYRRFGDPADVVDVVEAAAPAPGRGEVIVALEAAPVHLADFKHIRGLPWFDTYAPPHTPGYEGVGRICAIGAGVSGWTVGDRVFLPVGFGAWRERSAAKADELWRAPEGVAAEQLALLPINLTTAWLMLTTVVELQPGDWVLQNAANSNVGYYVVRLAQRLGLKTLNVVRRADRIADLMAAGATACLVDGDDLAQRAAEATGGQSIRLGFDAVAGDATGRIAACLAPGGEVAVYGLLSGQPCAVSPELLMFGDVRVSGFFTARTLAGFSPAQRAEMRRALDEFITGDALSTPIAGVYSFDQIAEALAHAARTEENRVGKIILKP